MYWKFWKNLDELKWTFTNSDKFGQVWTRLSKIENDLTSFDTITMVSFAALLTIAEGGEEWKEREEGEGERWHRDLLALPQVEMECSIGLQQSILDGDAIIHSRANTFCPDFFTYGLACKAIRSITRQSVHVDIVVFFVSSEFMNSVHRA